MFAPGLSKRTSRACIPVCRFSSGIPWYGIPPEFYGFFSGIPPDFCKFYKIPYSAEFQKKIRKIPAEHRDTEFCWKLRMYGIPWNANFYGIP